MTEHNDEKTPHTHTHEHDHDLHEHEHAHQNIIHKHAHYHEPLIHEHPHGHPDESGYRHERSLEHTHLPEHAHVHAYTFERYADLISPIHNMDSRVKMISVFLFIGTIVLTPPLPAAIFAMYALAIMAFLAISKLPWLFVLKRSSVIIPFVLFVVIFAPFVPHPGTYDTYVLFGIKLQSAGLIIIWNTLVKSWLSVILLVILTATTKFTDLLRALAWMRLPKTIIATLSFIYRYAFVFIYHMGNMLRALRARSLRGPITWQWRVLSQLLAGLFIRTYERGERLYDAMQSRGFSGEITVGSSKTLARADYVYILSSVLIWFGILWWRVSS